MNEPVWQALFRLLPNGNNRAYAEGMSYSPEKKELTGSQRFQSWVLSAVQIVLILVWIVGGLGGDDKSLLEEVLPIGNLIWFFVAIGPVLGIQYLKRRLGLSNWDFS